MPRRSSPRARSRTTTSDPAKSASQMFVIRIVSRSLMSHDQGDFIAGDASNGPYTRGSSQMHVG